MPTRPASAKSSLHATQDEGGTALLVLDMVSNWHFPDGSRLLAAAAGIAPVIQRLKARCKAAKVPVIYANDNAGRWRSDWRCLVDDADAAGGDAARIAHMLRPDDDDYFVLKPMHSAFFATPLQLLLQHLGVQHLVLCGVTSDQCVLASALQAHMHQHRVSVPRDAVAALTPRRASAALVYFEDVLRVRTTVAARLRLASGD